MVEGGERFAAFDVASGFSRCVQASVKIQYWGVMEERPFELCCRERVVLES